LFLEILVVGGSAFPVAKVLFGLPTRFLQLSGQIGRISGCRVIGALNRYRRCFFFFVFSRVVWRNCLWLLRS